MLIGPWGLAGAHLEAETWKGPVSPADRAPIAADGGR